MGIIVVVLSLCMEKGFCFVPGQVAFGFYSGCWVVGCESVVLLIFFEETVEVESLFHLNIVYDIDVLMF